MIATLTRRAALGLTLGALAARARAPERPDQRAFAATGLNRNETPELRGLINKYARVYDVPPSLIHRSIQRESGYNPGARNGPYYGLMQILPQTARTMGHRGPASELLNPDTNLRFAVKYLRGAWLLSNGNEATAIKWYASGYYYEAKRRGMLVETGLRAG
jgi:soluble lytic murein transglycosylase-like protein